MDAISPLHFTFYVGEAIMETPTYLSFPICASLEEPMFILHDSRSKHLRDKTVLTYTEYKLHNALLTIPAFLKSSCFCHVR